MGMIIVPTHKVHVVGFEQFLAYRKPQPTSLAVEEAVAVRQRGRSAPEIYVPVPRLLSTMNTACPSKEQSSEGS